MKYGRQPQGKPQRWPGSSLHQHVHRQDLSIRERLNGHRGKVIWFTGLSGSGKSMIANALEKELHAEGKRTYILDGDNVRQRRNKDLGFTDADWKTSAAWRKSPS